MNNKLCQFLHPILEFLLDALIQHLENLDSALNYPVLVAMILSPRRDLWVQLTICAVLIAFLVIDNVLLMISLERMKNTESLGHIW